MFTRYQLLNPLAIRLLNYYIFASKLFLQKKNLKRQYEFLSLKIGPRDSQDVSAGKES